MEQPYVIAVDTETLGFKWFDSEHPFLGTISDYDRDFLYRLMPSTAGDLDNDDFRRDILNADTLVFHNASFDIHQLVSSGVATMDELLSKTIHDTDLLARCVYGADNGPFGLKHLATELLDSNAGESERQMKEAMKSMGLIKSVDQKKLPDRVYYDVWKAYPDLVERYALKDTRYTYDLFYYLMSKATPDALEVYNLEMEVMPTIIRMEHTGTALDTKKAKELYEIYVPRKADLEQKLYELNGYETLNLDSNVQVADFLQRRGVKLTAKTPGGDYSVAEWALSKFKDDDEAVDAILEYSTTAKFLSTYIGPMQGRETVHPSFWQIGARTGRMSCSNPNMQNIPVRAGSEVRELFVPRDGYCFVVSDYSQIEPRILAYYMNDDTLKHVLDNGDIYKLLGSRIYGTDNPDEWPVTRFALKSGYLAMTYGAGGPRIAETIGGGMTADEGRALARDLKKALGPNYSILNKRIRQQVEGHGFVTTLGRRVQYVARDKSYVGLNALIQGSAADIMKKGLALTDKALQPFGGYPLLVIHDEIVSEVPLGTENEALAAQDAAMIAATDKVKLKVEGKVCYHSYAEGKD